MENTLNENDGIGQVQAKDLDSGLNGQVVYKLDDSAANYEQVKEIFDCDSQTGVIFVMSEIDREINSSIVLSLLAIDQGVPALTAKTDVQIFVLDMNDNAPTYDGNMSSILSIKENDMNVGLTLNATDLDLGSNGTIFYYIAKDESKKFLIDPITG